MHLSKPVWDGEWRRPTPARQEHAERLTEAKTVKTKEIED